MMDTPNQAFEIDDKDGKWHAEELSVDSQPLVDSGTGKPLIIRQFDFTFQAKLKQRPTKQQLFNEAWPLIRPLIKYDGLVASTDVDPRVLVGRKGYKIILLCEPKFGVMVADKPRTLQQVLKK